MPASPFRASALALACALLAVLPGCRKPAPASPLHFAREDVALEVRQGTLEVRATYHFQVTGPTSGTALIFYPFPLDSLHPYPDSVDFPGSRFERRDSGVAFPLPFQPGREASFSAYYRQPLLARSAVYIVTSTRRWRRPIDVAQFRVTVPLALQNVQLNWPTDSVVSSDTTATYFFTKTRFFPDRDIVVTWD